MQLQLVHSVTAELLFDDQFCRNGSDVEIDLNFSKSGNQSSLLHGLMDCSLLRTIFVLIRVQMLTQSCDSDELLVLFFDLSVPRRKAGNDAAANGEQIISRDLWDSLAH